VKILLPGSNGQVGRELLRQAAALGHVVIGTDSQTLDITDAAAVAAIVSRESPDVVINAAAYTAVDKAESDAEQAFSVNRDGPANLAAACAQAGIQLVHYSTDYVFDGSKTGAYVESDPVAPLGVYGKSKLAGEEAVRAAGDKHLILRTSWVFSAFGNNFVKTMLRLGAERDELGVVSDQTGKPTSAAEIARLTLALLDRHAGIRGTYHLAQPEAISWHGFAEGVFSVARNQGYPLRLQRLKAIGSDEYPTAAKRPVNSTLNCASLESVIGESIRSWRQSLADVVSELNHANVQSQNKRESLLSG